MKLRGRFTLTLALAALVPISVAVCCARFPSMDTVAVHIPVAGLYKSTVFVAAPPFWPPATRTIPEANNVAVA